MTAVWVLARARLRARWRALLGLTLLVGVASGAVMVAAIGARRTATAYPRLLEATSAEDVRLRAGGWVQDHPGFYGELLILPQVSDMGLASFALLAPDMGPGPRVFSISQNIVSAMSVDGRFGWTVNRPLILAGRRPDPDRADEVALSEALARRWGVRPGDTVRLRALTEQQIGPYEGGELVVPAGPRFTLRVVAIQRLPDDVFVTSQLAGEGFMLLTPAFYRANMERIANYPAEVSVRLRRGQADVEAFTAAVQRLSGSSTLVGLISREGLATNVEQATQAESVALGLFAVLAALAALVMIGQTLARELFLASTDDVTLRALGMSDARRFAAMTLPVGLVGVVGGLAGVGLAIVASPLTPIGLARRAEPDPGPVVHLAGLGIGLAATMVLVGGLAAVSAWRLARARPEATSATGRAGASSGLVGRAARAGLSPSSLAGLRMALEQRRGPTTVPVRTTLVGITAGIVALAAAITFTASLDHLLRTPSLYGWNFDAVTGKWDLRDALSREPPALTSNPNVGEF